MVLDKEVEDKYHERMKQLNDGYDLGYDEKKLLSHMLNVTSRIVDGDREDVPQSFSEATDPNYIGKYGEATESELLSILEHDVFDMELYDSVPSNADLVDSKWVFDIKNVTTGGSKRYKARLVIRGFLQHYLKSYFDTYSPTSQKDSLREILALSAIYILRTIHIDIKTAFLYGELKPEEILYCKVPDGYCFRNLYQKFCTPDQRRKFERMLKSGKKGFLRMRKSCYGTKQAAKNWYEKLDQILIGLGYNATPCDPCLYIRWMGNDFILVTGTSEKMFQELCDGLNQQLEVVNLGEIKQILGMVVTHQSNGDILLNNEIYIENMLMVFDSESTDTKETPAPGESVLSKEDCIRKEDYDVCVQNRYRSLIGSLLYAAICWRPDIMYRVAQLARFNGVAGPIHVKAGNYLLRYLRGTSNWGLFFKGESGGRKIQPIFITSCDASYAGNEDHISVSGWTRQMVDLTDWNNHIVKEDGNVDMLPNFNCTSYSSHRQKGVIATSSTEA